MVDDANQIAQRAFKLALQLDEYIAVQQAVYENGLLKVDLQRVIPEEKLPCKIVIQATQNQQQTLEHAQTVIATEQ